MTALYHWLRCLCCRHVDVLTYSDQGLCLTCTSCLRTTPGWRMGI